MGLDVYVGSLTRYHCGDWETVVQRAARESGTECHVVRPEQQDDVLTDPEEVGEAVLGWREALSSGLVDAGGPPLVWDERADAPYFTDKPAWDAYGDLVLRCAYDEQGKVPPEQSSDDWAEDPAYLKASEEGKLYTTLCRGVEVWVPVEFPFTFQADWFGSGPKPFGSVQQLCRELSTLNERLWKADDEMLSQWRAGGKERSEPLERGAKFAAALMLQLAREAERSQLVMLLDY